MPTLLPDARRSPRFAGLTTFGRYPRLQDVTADNQPVDWAVYGVPFDGGVTYRPGTRFGPRAIRDESQYLKRFSLEHGIDLCATLSLADAGDSPLTPYSCELCSKAQLDFARSLGDPRATRLLALGGDHSIAYANMRATFERLGGAVTGGSRSKSARGMALVHFDSHLDTIDAVWGEKWGHASVFRRAIEDELVDPRRMISIGIKGPLNTPDDLNFARDHGVEVVPYERYLAAGPDLLRAFVKRIGETPVYISFDIDCVDPAFAPGTGTPSVGGFTSAEILRALRLLKGINVVGADVVEVLPDRDPAGITALLAAHIAFEILCLDAVHRRPSRAPTAKTRSARR